MAARQPESAITLLKADHEKISELFKTYTSTRDRAMKQRIAQQVFLELAIHAQLEEELFYPAFADAADEAGKILVENSLQDHQMIKDMIEELRELHDEEFDAKFYELMEDLQIHVLEEEAEMFPQAEAMLTAEMAELFTGMQAMKKQRMAR